MIKRCPIYKCGCSLDRCDPDNGRCAANGTAEKQGADEMATKTKACAKRGHDCTSLACTKGDTCRGAPCPVDGDICALGKCVVSNMCAWDEYYPEHAVKRTETTKKDEKLAPATVPVTAAIKPAPVVHKRACHTGMVEVWGGESPVRLFLGGRNDWALWQREPDLTLSLLGASVFNREPDLLAANAAALAILPADLLFVKSAPRLAIDWPDYGVPELPESWWNTLVGYIKDRVEKDGKFDLAIHCEGGHGRTGTAAAILVCKLGMIAGGCPVEWLRTVYCKEVVESDAQVAYIERMTGWAVEAEANMDWPAVGAYDKGKGGTGYTNAGKGWSDSFWDRMEQGTHAASTVSTMVSAADEVANYKSAKAIEEAVGLSKNRRKKLLRLWNRKQLRMLGKK